MKTKISSITRLRASNRKNQTAKNAKVAKKMHAVFLPFLANLAFLAVQIVRCSKSIVCRLGNGTVVKLFMIHEQLLEGYTSAGSPRCFAASHEEPNHARR